MYKLEQRGKQIGRLLRKQRNRVAKCFKVFEYEIQVKLYVGVPRKMIVLMIHLKIFFIFKMLIRVL